MKLPDSGQIVITCLVVIAASYLYVGLEWLFFVTKPSLLNYLQPIEQFWVLAVAPLPLAISAVVSTVLIFIPLSFLTGCIPVLGTGLSNRLLVFTSAVIVSCTEFILIENFSYTVFAIGVSSFSGSARYFHTVIFIGLIIVNTNLLNRLIIKDSSFSRLQKPLFWVCVPLVALSVFGILISQSSIHSGINVFGGKNSAEKRAFDNVLIFSSDGIDARHMSAYGYERPTTPFIESLLKESLVFENHFTNSAKTTGSVGSLLSTKYPTTTRVIFRPDIFTQIHTYQHLPGYLRQFGFTNGDLSIRHYVDPYDLNMREGFDYANGRNLDEEGLPLPDFFQRNLTSATLFLEEIFGRISSRLLHISGIRTMYNPYLAVTRPDSIIGRSSDRERMERLKQFIDGAEKPFFANVHLMNTHGSYFPTEKQVFTAGRTQTKKWDKDFYDDSILQYDRYVHEIVQFLRDRDLLDSTLLVLNTDHGFRWGINRSLPLIIRYPGAEHTGIIKTNSQRLDIAPTILEHLEIDVPDWMEGKSLINYARDPMEPIYISNRAPSGERHGWRVIKNPKPPFYTLGSINAIYCDRIYTLGVISDKFITGSIKDHSRPCSAGDFPDEAEIHRDLISHLESAGYDVSGLRRP